MSGRLLVCNSHVCCSHKSIIATNLSGKRFDITDSHDNIAMGLSGAVDLLSNLQAVACLF